MSSFADDALVTFFVYTMFIYPISSFLASPSRSYSKFWRIAYPIVFLVFVCMLQLSYDSGERGLNYYEQMHIEPGEVNLLRRAYKIQSLELHPDKNKSPTATDDFQALKHAYDVLSDPVKRSWYDRFGDNEGMLSLESSKEPKSIVLQLLIYYSFTAVFTFFMTMPSSSSTFLSDDTTSVCFIGLAVILLIEVNLSFNRWSVPTWLLPRTLPFEIVSLLHRIYPAFLNGCRCILSSYGANSTVESLADGRVTVLRQLSDQMKSTVVKVENNLCCCSVENDASMDGMTAAFENYSAINKENFASLLNSKMNTMEPLRFGDQPSSISGAEWMEQQVCYLRDRSPGREVRSPATDSSSDEDIPLQAPPVSSEGFRVPLLLAGFIVCHIILQYIPPSPTN